MKKAQWQHDPASCTAKQVLVENFSSLLGAGERRPHSKTQPIHRNLFQFTTVSAHLGEEEEEKTSLWPCSPFNKRSEHKTKSLLKGGGRLYSNHHYHFFPPMVPDLLM